MLISLFITCYNDVLFPNTGKAVVRVLESLGHEVEFRSEQTCCGQMHYNSGYRHDAVRLMRRFVGLFENADVIAVPSASCVSMIREHYPLIAAKEGDPALRAATEVVVARVYEFSELLIDRLGVMDVGAFFPHTVTLHSSCHSLRSLKVGDKPTRLLKAVRGLTLRDMDRGSECCGFGGTFAIKNPDVSAAMLADKSRCVLNTGAEICTALDNSCLMHIGGGLTRQRTGVRTMHIAEILASTGGDGPR